MADKADTNTTGLYSDSRQPPYGMMRSQRKELLSKMTFSPSYTTNTAKESTVLEFVDTFRAQYQHLYPTRGPLLLSPHNECEVRKFISTFVRPTLLPYSELYDWDKCAKYVAGYIMYDALEANGDSYPQSIMSPTTTMAWQVGNCVEMSIVLTSLLIGAGYNAYTVLGFASKDVAECELKYTPWADKLPEETFSDDADDHVNTNLNTRFAAALKQRPKLQSTFDNEQKKKQQEDEAAAHDAIGAGATSALKDGDEDPDDAKRYHAWVVILPKKRGIEKAIFIEPSTGAEFTTDDPGYFNVEAVFNHQNYFVNMDPGAHPANINFDLYDLTQWEHLFLSDPNLVSEDDGAEAGGTERAKVEDHTDLGDAGDFLMDLPASWVDPLALNRSQYENRYPGRTKTVRYAEGVVVTLFAEYSDAELRVLEVQCPDDEMETRSQVHTFYKHRKDHLRRISRYPSVERSGEWRKLAEYYLPGRKKDGRVEGLRAVIEEPGRSRTLRFYWRSREDGLAERREDFFNEKDPQPRKVTERYRGRTEDRLFYRSATYDPTKDAGAAGDVTLLQRQQAARDGGANARDEVAHRQPRKMTEKFRRHSDVPANRDVAKRTFVKPLQSDGEVWVRYHYGDDSITQATRCYLKSSEKDRDITAGAGSGGDFLSNFTWYSMPFDEAPKPFTLMEELKALIAAEKECLQEIRTRENECHEIFSGRNSAGTEPLYSVYDTLRNRPQETEAERERQRREERRRQESRKDYLAPYIATLEVSKSSGGDYSSIRLSEPDARRVRDAALKDLRDRLIQRGHIMQQRMDREKEELNRKQAAYQKDLDQPDRGKDDTFAEFLAAATWRMKILDDRLTRHIEQASDKYAQLAQKLANDQRLAVLYEGAGRK